ncbi:hypothetical protein NPIL_260141 [Nephila pilipes]|uniref:Uncharacterized protein n=1 Tax=Nephila pilipes TaxID=299642 RepID=A0A8X6TAE1_NEPPI|nr:hypothetical protein NPIL_260141 [Nephila pilipes]
MSETTLSNNTIPALAPTPSCRSNSSPWGNNRSICKGMQAHPSTTGKERKSSLSKNFHMETTISRNSIRLNLCDQRPLQSQFFTGKPLLTHFNIAPPFHHHHHLLKPLLGHYHKPENLEENTPDH